MRSPLESSKLGSMGPVLFRRHSRERCSNSTAHPLHANPQAHFHRCFRPRSTSRRSQRPERPPRIVRRSCTASMSRLKLPCQPTPSITRDLLFDAGIHHTSTSSFSYPCVQNRNAGFATAAIDALGLANVDAGIVHAKNLDEPTHIKQ